MLRLTFAVVAWCAAYIVIVSVPLMGGVLNLAHGRGFWLNFSIALGFVALSIFGAQFVNVLRVRPLTAPFGILTNFELHGRLGYAGFAFALAHPLLLFALDRKYWALLDVTTSPLRAKFAVGASLALIAMVALARYRTVLRIHYRTWHALHWLLAMVVFGGGLVHAVLVNYYLEDKAEQAIWVSLGLIFVAAALWMRFGNPYVRWRRRWQVQAVSAPTDGVVELSLVQTGADVQGRKAFTFRAGQFAWLIVGRSPFSISANPFTIASSAQRPECLRFIVRINSGYTSALRALQPGTRVYLDGPHGTFTMDEEVQGPLILIGAGVGVTPMLSMAETLADQGSARPVVLMLSNRRPDEVVGGEHFEALRGRLNLAVHQVFSSQGQRMDDAFIARHLPPGASGGECFICGGTAFMDMAAAALRNAGIDATRIHAERFAMA